MKTPRKAKRKATTLTSAETYGRVLREARLKAGLSQEELSEALREPRAVKKSNLKAVPELTRAEAHKRLRWAFATFVKEYRQKKGLTAKQVQARMNRLTPETLANILLRMRCVSAVLKTERQNAGLSIKQLASRAGVDVKKLASMEKEKRLEELTLEEVYDLSEALSMGFMGLWVEAFRVAQAAKRKG